MIKAVIFDLDNTLIDFMYIKNQAVNAAINGMIESGLKIPFNEAKKKIYNIYEQQGYEYQEVLNQFIKDEYDNIACFRSLISIENTLEDVIDESKFEVDNENFVLASIDVDGDDLNVARSRPLVQ